MRAITRLTGCRIVAMVAATMLAVTACSASDTDPLPTGPPRTSSSPPAKPAPPDQNLRDTAKAMIYSDGIAYVLSETAAQMICGTLSAAEWSDAFGGVVGRVVYGGVDATCVVATGTVTVTLQMTVRDLDAEGERIHGRRVKVDTASASGRVAAASAAVVPLGEQDVPAQQRVGADPVLHLLATMTDMDQPPPDLPALLRRLLTVLLPRLTPTGPATPVYDAGKLAYNPTDRPAGVPIYDLPQTVQSLVLCTVVLREAGIKAQPASGVLVNSVGECSIDRPRAFAKVDRFLHPVPESSPFKLAGRAAEERADIGIVINLLTTPTKYDRIEYLTVRLNNYTQGEPLRTWAEKVAPALLTG